MPDVFKILNDVELKAVGFDPETNARPSQRNGCLLTAGQLRLNNRDAVRPSARTVSDDLKQADAAADTAIDHWTSCQLPATKQIRRSPFATRPRYFERRPPPESSKRSVASGRPAH